MPWLGTKKRQSQNGTRKRQRVKMYFNQEDFKMFLHPKSFWHLKRQDHKIRHKFLYPRRKDVRVLRQWGKNWPDRGRKKREDKTRLKTSHTPKQDSSRKRTHLDHSRTLDFTRFGKFGIMSENVSKEIGKHVGVPDSNRIIEQLSNTCHLLIFNYFRLR